MTQRRWILVKTAGWRVSSSSMKINCSNWLNCSSLLSVCITIVSTLLWQMHGGANVHTCKTITKQYTRFSWPWLFDYFPLFWDHIVLKQNKLPAKPDYWVWNSHPLVLLSQWLIRNTTESSRGKIFMKIRKTNLSCGQFIHKTGRHFKTLHEVFGLCPLEVDRQIAFWIIHTAFTISLRFLLKAAHIELAGKHQQWGTTEC